MVVFCVILYCINLFSSWQESLVNVYIWKISEEYSTKKCACPRTPQEALSRREGWRPGAEAGRQDFITVQKQPWDPGTPQVCPGADALREWKGLSVFCPFLCLLELIACILFIICRPVVKQVQEKVFTSDAFQALDLHPHLVSIPPWFLGVSILGVCSFRMSVKWQF